MNRIRVIVISAFFLCILNSELTASSRLTFLRVHGAVNSQEVGSGAYAVISVWDERGPVLVHPDNSFFTVVGSQRPQKVTLVDSKKKIRALAVFIPGYTQTLLFDAQSTALAVLFTDSRNFSHNQQVAAIIEGMGKEPAVQAFVAYLRRNLPTTSLEDLSTKKEYIELVENCQKEVFGEDQKEILKSLKSAEKELEKVME